MNLTQRRKGAEACWFVGLFVLLCASAPLRELSADDAAQRAKDAIVVRALMRLPGVDLSVKPEAKAALLRHLETVKGSEQYLDLVEKFKLRDAKDELLRLLIERGDSTLGVRAAGLLVKFDELKLLQEAIADPDRAKATKFLNVLGLLADAKTNDWIAPLVTDTNLALPIRSAAVTALGRNGPGQKQLLRTVEEGKLPMDLQFAAANALLSSADDAIRAAAGKHLSLPAGAGGEGKGRSPSPCRRQCPG